MLLAIICGALALALGLVFAGDHSPSGVDDVVWSAVGGWPHGVLDALVLPTEPYVLLPVLALLVFLCRSRPWDALFVVVAPGLAVAVNTWGLKPLFGRWKGDTLVYPSGHTVSLVATLVVVFVLVRGRARAITAVVGAVSLVAAAVGMVGLGYHYVDVLGGACFAVFAVLAVFGIWPRSGPGTEYRWLVLSRRPWRG